MDKKKILKVVLAVILIVIVIFLVNTFRKFAIIKEIQENVSQYISSENYHIREVSKEQNAIISTMNYYKKNGKIVVIIEHNSNGEYNKMSIYEDNGKTDVFFDNTEEKTVDLDTESMNLLGIYDYFATDNDFQTLLASISTKIREENYNGKECYIIEGFLSQVFLNGVEKNEVYVEKETGLYVRINIDDAITTEREYEFNNVDDGIFVEPDVSQYELLTDIEEN